ncbi:MAG: RsmD family RNA methyltransferase [Micrococcus sp.]|nr:RsmD family RNA methyltransferase [Micrococcus sp.]
MGRIIAGAAVGTRLRSVPGTGTRPTTDRTKEALFSWLDARDWLADTVVADLFAGSGALGLEAASRGAREVTLVERERRAVEVCRANAALVNRSLGRSAVRVQPGPVERFLEAAGADTVDLILADPPYPLEGPGLDRVLAAAAITLTAGGLLMLERATRSVAPARPESLEEVDVKTYGETRLYFWQDTR